MKRLILATFILCFISLAAHAQYDYKEWGIGASFGRVKAYSDLETNYADKAYSVSIYWNYSPYLPFAFEAQTGKLSGGGVIIDQHTRLYANNYLGFNFHGDLQLGEIVDFGGSTVLSSLKGLYSGIGVGAMFNNITDVQRYSAKDPTYLFPGKDRSVTLLVPVRFGYEFKIFNYDGIPFMGINVGYTHNLTFAESLDGYDDPSKLFKNNAQDMFGGWVVGVKFNFGNWVQYSKPIR